MESGNPLWAVVVIAVIVESLVNIVVNIREDDKSWKYWLAFGVSLVAGAGLSWIYGVDVFSFIGLQSDVPIVASVVGPVVTGLLASRGSNLVSDMVGLINSWKKTA